MDDSTYSAQVARVLKVLTRTLDEVDQDLLDADVTGDMCTITALRTGAKVIINTQKSVHQLWVAGQGAGIHFSLSPDNIWLDDKGKGLELFSWISECVLDASGATLDFDATQRADAPRGR